MTSTAPHRPFAFDTEFNASGDVVRASSFRPTKRSFLPEEVEAMVAQASQDAREAALAEVASQQAQALSIIAQSIMTTAPMLAQVAEAHRAQAAELALEAARSLAGVAFERLPTGPLQTAMEMLGQEIDASPRLVIRMGGLDDEMRTRLEAVAAEAGYRGMVSFRDEPGGHPAAFELEWADGRAAFDPNEAAKRMAEALASALAADAGHAERLNEGRPE